MKNLLLKIQYALLTIYYFMIGPESVQTPSSKPIVFPDPREFPYRKGKWNRDEVVVSLYLKMHGIEKLGLTIKNIADSIGRTEAAMERKLYRLDKLVKELYCEEHEFSRLDDEMFQWFKMLSEQGAELEFLSSMVVITRRIQTGVSGYFQMRLSGAISLK